MTADHVPTVVVSSTFHTRAKRLHFPFATLDKFLFQHPELLMTKEDLATISHLPQPPARNPDGAGNSTTQAHVSLALNANTSTNADSVVASTQQSGAGTGHPINKYTITTPLQPLQFERELRGHPDKSFVARLLQDLTNGCKVGYEGPRFQCIAPHLPSAYVHSDVIDNSIT